MISLQSYQCPFFSYVGFWLLLAKMGTKIVKAAFSNFNPCYFFFSVIKNVLKPNSLISSRFLILLILYLVRYLLSKCFRSSQGNFSHSKQYFASLVWKIMQFFILHLTRVMGLFKSAPLQPGHLFLSLRYAWQIPQFIPHGAMNEVSFKDPIILFTLFFIFQRGANSNAHCGNYKIPYSYLCKIICNRHS